VKSLLLPGVSLSLLVLAPGSLNLIYSLGGETAIPQLLPRNWSFLPSSHWKGRYGFIPAGSRREACVLLEIIEGRCALGQSARIQPRSLKSLVRLEFELEIETTEAVLPAGTYAGFLLRAGSDREAIQWLSWKLPELSDEWESLGQGRYRVRNGIDLESRDLGQVQGLDIQVLIAGRGTYRVFSPRMWEVTQDGTRHPFE
jgi:hypothetical protein